MLKKVIIVLCLLLLSGCQMYYINSKSHEEIVNLTITSNNDLYNNNNVGYRYFLPIGFEVSKDDEYNQVLTSKGYKYYLYVDIISYYYKNSITTVHDINDYEYFTFEHDSKTGYLKVTKDNDYFFVELCYNYAIIEVEVDKDNLTHAISHGIAILSSIKYNDLIIEKYIGDNDMESSETIYKIPSPDKKSDDNLLEYIDENENNVNDN